MQEKAFSLNDLQQLIKQKFEHHHLRFNNIDNARQVVVNGDLLFDMFPSGLAVHCCDMTEYKTGSCSSNISPCISMNLLFKGELVFCLSDNVYRFYTSDTPILFINIVSQADVFTRHLSEGNTVCKTNVTIEKAWFLARCQTAQDVAQINALFAQPTSVYQLVANESIVNIARHLLNYKLAGGVHNELLAEQLTLQFINEVLPQLLSPTLGQNKVYCDSSTDKCNVENKSYVTQDKFKVALEAVADNKVSLKQLSQTLGMSVSTLQRKFKETHQVTVIEYLRIKRLEKARSAIVIDGLSIGESAYAAGYTHVANFVTAFKKRFGVTPAQLRNQHQGIK